MANPKPIPSRNSARPGMLEQPQSGDDMEAQLAAAQASAKPASLAATPTPVPTPAPAAQSSEDEKAALMSELEAEYANVEAEMGAEPSFAEANLTGRGLAQQFGEAEVRTRASFATSDKEKQQVLNDRFGKENVVFRDGKFKVRREAGGKFTSFDPETFDLLTDALDFSREAVEEAVAVPAEAAGAVTGGPLGLAAGRAVGAAAGTNVADLVAENLLGIERDPNRSRLLETGLASTLTSMFGALGDKVSSTMARKAAAKKLAVPEHEAISTSSNELLQNTRQLRDLGKLEVGPGGKVTLLPHQVDPTNPKAWAWAKEVSGLPAFAKLMKDQAETADKLITDTLMEASNLAGKGPLAPEQLGKRISDFAGDIRQAEGQAITEFRRMAGAKLGPQVKILPTEPLQTIYDLTLSMGFSPKELAATAKPTKEILSNIQGSMGIGSEGEARFFFNQMKQVASRMQRGNGMSFDDLEGTINVLAKGNKQARRAGGEVSALYNRLTSQLRETRNDLVRQNIPKEALPGFEKSMSRFRDVLQAQQNLGDALSEDISTKAFVNSVFSEGKTGLAKLQSAKALLAETYPQAWDSLKGSYLEQLVQSHTKETGNYAGKLDAAGIKKQILTMGSEAREILFDGSPESMKNFMSALDYGQRIKETSFTHAATETKKEVTEGLMAALANSAYMKAKAVLAIVGAADDKPSKFMEMLSDEGVDKFFGKVPKGRMEPLRKMLSEAQDEYRQMVIRGSAPKALAPVRRATRATIRDAAKETAAPGGVEESP